MAVLETAGTLREAYLLTDHLGSTSLTDLSIPLLSYFACQRIMPMVLSLM